MSKKIWFIKSPNGNGEYFKKLFFERQQRPTFHVKVTPIDPQSIGSEKSYSKHKHKGL